MEDNISQIRSQPCPTTCPCMCHQLCLNPVHNVDRPSVIMAPVSNRNYQESNVMHTPVQFETVKERDKPHSNIQGKEYANSVEVISDDEEERFFRFDLDGQKAKFKLTKREWELIDITEFPSGGRLLGGAWTTIFKRGIRNSNPWCSLRFKNNHVRAANSRKMNSAPFFRGAGECKREECNMKLKLTIQEEKGKFVMVTYTGNVCHKVSLRNDDEVKPKESK